MYKAAPWWKRMALRRWERYSLAFQATAVVAMGVAAALTVPWINLVDYLLLLAGLALFARLSARRRFSLGLHALLAALFLLHGLGVLGSYGPPLWGLFSYDAMLWLRYDKWLHFLGAVAGALFFAEWLPRRLARWQRLLLAFLALLGIAALVETVEFLGTLAGLEKGGILTQEAGRLVVPAENALDTSTDLLANVIGALLGTAIAWARGVRRPPS